MSDVRSPDATGNSDGPFGAEIAASDLPIRLISGETTPIYLQISQQIKHLIVTHQLDDGTRLPAVRRLADHLEINPGTVVQAYRELSGDQLIESVRGRGTIVRRLSSSSADDVARARLLADAAARLAIRARALGFDPAEARAQLNRALLDAPTSVPVVFVAWTAAQAARYVDELNRDFADRGVEFVPHGIEDVAKGVPSLLAELEVAYTVVTFVTLAPEVERTLAEAGVSAEIIGLTVSMSEHSVEQLRSMSPDQRYTLVTEHRAVTTALAQIEAGSGLGHDTIEVVATSPDGSIDAGRLDDVAAGDSVVIFSFGVIDEITSRAIPAERLIELRFALTDSARDRLDRRWAGA